MQMFMHRYTHIVAEENYLESTCQGLIYNKQNTMCLLAEYEGLSGAE